MDPTEVMIEMQPVLGGLSNAAMSELSLRLLTAILCAGSPKLGCLETKTATATPPKMQRCKDAKIRDRSATRSTMLIPETLYL